MVAHQSLELTDRLGMAAERQVGLQPRLDRGQAQFLEPRDLARGERLEFEPRKRRSSPQAERRTQYLTRLTRFSPRKKLAAPLEQGFELIQVERAWLQAQPIPRRLRLHHALAEHLPQLRDVHLHRLDGCRRRPLVPQLVDQPCRRHDLVRPQEQDRKQRPLFRRAEGKLATVVPGGERAENAELHAANVPP